MLTFLVGWICASVPASAQSINWSPPRYLNTNAVEDNCLDQNPHIAGDGAGHLVACWDVNDPTADSDSSGDRIVMAASSQDDGESWSTPTRFRIRPAGLTATDAWPGIALSPNGTAILVWSHTARPPSQGYATDIYFSRSTDFGATWSAPSPLYPLPPSNPNSRSSLQVRIACDNAQNFVVTWYQHYLLPYSNSSAYSASTDGGLTWSSPAVIPYPYPSVSLNGDPVSGGSGKWFVAWYENTSIKGAYSTDYGLSWASPFTITQLPAGSSPGFSFPYVAYGNAIRGAATTDGEWLALWTVESGTTTTSEPFYAPVSTNIMLSRSSANGTTWSTPLAIPTLAAGDDPTTSLHYGTDLKVDAANRALVSWSYVYPDNYSYWGEGESRVAVGFPDGSWTSPTRLSIFPPSQFSVNSGAKLAARAGGLWSAAWLSTDNGDSSGFDFDLVYANSLDYGTTWSQPKLLNTYGQRDNTTSDYIPQLAAAPDGTQIAVWVTGSFSAGPTALYFTRSTDFGHTWNAPALLTPPQPYGSRVQPQYLHIATDQDGTWIVVWQDSTNFVGYNVGPPVPRQSDVLYSRSTDNGITWNSPMRVNTDTGNASVPSIATDRSNKWMIAWQTANIFDFYTSQSQVLSSRSTDDGGTWSVPQQLSVPGYSAFWPHVAAVPGGPWVMAWHTGPDNWSPPYPLTESPPDSDVVARTSFDAGQNWSAPVTLNQDSASTVSRNFYPRVLFPAADKWTIYWCGGSPPREYYQLDVMVSRSEDQGQTWSVPVGLQSPSDVRYLPPAAVTDLAGRGVIVWSAITCSTDTDVYYSLTSDAGSTWTLPAMLNATGEADTYAGDYNPSIATDGLGHWTVGWSSDYNFITDRSADRDLHFSWGLFPNNTACRSEWQLYE